MAKSTTRKKTVRGGAASVVVLGATGSVGSQTLDVLRERPGAYRAAGLAAGRPGRALAALVREWAPEVVCVAPEAGPARLQALLSSSHLKRAPRILHGPRGLELLAALPDADIIVNALSGAAGIGPSIAAVRAGKTLLTANKEALVAAGALIMSEAARAHAPIIPLDSEHASLFRLLYREPAREVRRVILTASGGPFLRARSLSRVTPAQALKHPSWNMGPKISVDSATLMNKGFEIIEAMWLFDMPIERIDVLIHPESAVHALVEFCDGTTHAFMAEPDMRIPIRAALDWPRREPLNSTVDLARLGSLTFELPDERRFPCLALARAAAAEKGLLPAMIAAADEAAVAAFLKNRIRFTDIPNVIEHVLECGRNTGAARETVTENSVSNADAEARRAAAGFIKKIRK